jgi:pSer/pThr/pTyr-binding forkhead associated (FHA) protein
MTATVVLVLRIGLAVLLYLFLWKIYQTLQRDIRQNSRTLALQEKPGIQLEAKLENGEINKYRFRQTEILIGRASNCDISLPDGVLSSVHARIAFHHAQWWVEDADSTNGTFLNGSKVMVPTVIISGDELKCGKTAFTVNIEQPEASELAKQIDHMEA